MGYRRTLRREVACTGIGLHSGRPVHLRLRPAPAEHGIRFLQADVGVEIPATLQYLGGQDHATTLTRDGVSIGTIEHLLAALGGLGIDDVLVEVDGPEVPARAKSAQLHKLVALARNRKTPLILRPVQGDLPSGLAHLRLEARRVLWEGTDEGHGRLSNRKLIFEASGKAMRGMTRLIEVEDDGTNALRLVSGLAVAPAGRATG